LALHRIRRARRRRCSCTGSASGPRGRADVARRVEGPGGGADYRPRPIDDPVGGGYTSESRWPTPTSPSPSSARPPCSVVVSGPSSPDARRGPPGPRPGDPRRRSRTRRRADALRRRAARFRTPICTLVELTTTCVRQTTPAGHHRLSPDPH
jgi:hypothetical protein